jgi:hypothetical protein
MKKNNTSGGPSETPTGTGWPPKIEISPPDLGEWGDQYLSQVWDNLCNALTAEEFSMAIVELVHHARHLDPLEHAILAKHVKTGLEGFHRGRGRPKAEQRDREIWQRYFLFQPRPRTHRERSSEDIANRYNISLEDAKKQYDKVKKLYTPKKREKNR